MTADGIPVFMFLPFAKSRSIIFFNIYQKKSEEHQLLNSPILSKITTRCFGDARKEKESIDDDDDGDYNTKEAC